MSLCRSDSWVGLGGMATMCSGVVNLGLGALRNLGRRMLGGCGRWPSQTPQQLAYISEHGARQCPNQLWGLAVEHGTVGK